MKKILTILLYFIIFPLNANAEEYTHSDYQNELYETYYSCYYKLYNKDRLSFEAGLIYLPPQELKKCTNKLKLLYETFVSDPKKNDSQKYHYSRLWYPWETFKFGNHDEKKEAFIILEELFNDKYYQDDNFYKLRAAGSLGWTYYTEIGFRDDEKAFKFLKYAADHNEEYSINNLGVLYDQGRAVKRNYKKAYELYKKSAMMGNHWAHGNIAKFYLFGFGGVKKNYEKTIRHYKLARITDLGNEQFTDLVILFNKKKLPLNVTEYLSWYEESIIKNQDPLGFQQIAWFADDGAHDNEEGKLNSYKWHYLASKYSPDKDDKIRSPQEMDFLEKKVLSKEQIARAIKEANEWMEKNWKN